MMSWMKHLACHLGHTQCRRVSHQVLHGRGTIFALSSSHGRAGVAVIRVSGPSTSESLRQMVRRIPPPRKAALRRIYHPQSTEAIDKGLVLWFPGPRSFTGEDCAEFQVHGGAAVVTAMLTALGELPGFRHAEAGEFTKRAYMNGQLDLTEVEGLSDLISAETEAQRHQALRQMEGDLGNMYMAWRKRIIKCLANVEAYIDFSEDENIEDGVLHHARSEVKVMVGEMKSHLHDNRRGERLRSGVRVAIIGEPNVGKSSLLNALCQRPAAIVSPIAGTTRDVVETALNIGGYPVLLSDTAGLRETGDAVEKEGVRRAVERAKQADIKIILVDATTFSLDHTNFEVDKFVSDHLHDLGVTDRTKHEDREAEREMAVAEDAVQQSEDRHTVLVVNKCDLVPSWNPPCPAGDVPTAALSCTTGAGMKNFTNLLAERVKLACGNPLSGNPSLTKARHRHHLTQCVSHLESYLNLEQDTDVVLSAHQLRKAARELGKITGKITSEDILDIIFKDFCIGK
ncbi:tRNA modification GTPase GTPBP3, mitochondrial-like [Haliotis cracherodii]|uniref:tRNA modification GTPase GTPBP3, mitochondrial-like n=1 Tax=Haliotis cracherodii TaxID=6455 RepID=UPI0039EA144B